MRVPAFDLSRQYQQIGVEVQQAVARVMASGHYILAEQVEALEEELAAYSHADYAIGVANGSDAIHLALMAFDIGPGDEVIIPAFTFFATAGAVARTGATPVFADIDPVTFNLDPDSFERKITPRTRAVIPVHLYGNPADLNAICAVARRHGIRVIEDAAQAIGSEYGGRRIGGIGDFTTLSFYPTKNLGAYGDAGMVLTNDQNLATRVRMLRAHGAKKKYHHDEMGYNSRLDEMQAAILRVKLQYLDEWTAARRNLAAQYDRLFAGTAVVAPRATPESKHVFHQYTVRVAERDSVQAALAELGIGSTVYYPLPLHLQPVFAAHGHRLGDFPQSEQACKEALSLPMFPEMANQEVEHVAAKLIGLASAPEYS